MKQIDLDMISEYDKTIKGYLAGYVQAVADFEKPVWETKELNTVETPAVALQPGVLYYLGILSNAITIDLDDPDTNGNEWKFSFITSDTVNSITFPENVMLPYGFDIAPKTRYEFSILKDPGGLFATYQDWGDVNASQS